MAGRGLYQGQTARFYVTVVDDIGTPLDVPDITLRLRPPDGGSDVDYALSLGQVLHPVAGQYQVFVLLDRAGVWKYRWTTATVPIGVDGGAVVVERDDLA